MPANQVALAGHLPFGRGSVGRECAQDTPEEQIEFGHGLSPFVRRLTVLNTADCVEDRPVVQLGDITDPEVIAERIACRLPGGLYFAVSKAAVAADLSSLRDARSYQEAYENTGKLLVEFGYPDAGHEHCGASGSLEGSVADEIPLAQLMAALPALVAVGERTRYYLERNLEAKTRKLEGGFYGGWDSGWHADHLSEKSPAHFARLAKDPAGQPVKHKAKGLVVVKDPGSGFATTDYNRQTGKMAFAITPEAAMIYDIADRLCASDEEKARFLLDIKGGDPAGVLNGLAAEGLPVYAAAA